MKDPVLPIQIHTIRQLLAPLGIINQRHGLHVVSTSANDEELPILYPFRSDHFSFLIVTGGELLVKVNLLDYQLKENHVLLLTPNAVRQFIKVSADCKVTSIVFTADYLSCTSIHTKHVEAFEFLSPQGNPQMIINKKELHVLLEITKTLELKMEIQNDQAFQEEVLLHLFTGFIYEISSLYQKQETIMEVKGTRKEDLTFRFLKILPQYFKEKRSVHAYATMLSITPKYLSQTVKEVTGKTAGEFIDEMVTMEAKVVLNNPALTIAQIASYLNFSDQFFFSKYFKKQCGMSPSQYRKSA